MSSILKALGLCYNKAKVKAMATVSGLGITRCGGAEFRWDQRTYVMGIINVTPDSFSGDGLGDDLEATLAQARR